MKAVKAFPPIRNPINSLPDHISSLPADIQKKIMGIAADQDHTSLHALMLQSKQFQGLICESPSEPIPRRVAAIHQLNTTIREVDAVINLENDVYEEGVLQQQINALDQAAEHFSKEYKPDLTIVLALFYLKLKAEIYLGDDYNTEVAKQLLRKVDSCRLFSKKSEKALLNVFKGEDFKVFLPDVRCEREIKAALLIPLFLSIRSKRLTEGSFVYKACQLLMD